MSGYLIIAIMQGGVAHHLHYASQPDLNRNTQYIYYPGNQTMSNQASIFSPDTFLDATTTEESVKRPPLPAGMEFTATIKVVKTRAWQGKKDPTQGGIAADLTIEFDLTAYPDIQKLLGGLDKVQIVDGIMLDLTEGGSIDYSPGKNSKLRRYREATVLNVAGQPFSLRMLEGRLVKARIKHESYEGEIYDKIESVAKV